MTTPRHSILAAALLGMLAASCSREPEPVPQPTADAVAPADTAPAPVVTPSPPPLPPRPFARIAGAEGSGIAGELTFEPVIGGVHISGTIAGLAPDSEHGFHVHETGDCSAPAEGSAGKHYNPAQQPHGGPDATARHLGDLPNLRADASGNAVVDSHLADVNVGTRDDRDLVGRAVIVHETRDDYSTQPSGASGTPIACGIIELPASTPGPAALP
jgi:Cu-Zn family superoxide dismutase